MKTPFILLGVLLLAGCRHSQGAPTPGVELDDAPSPHQFSKDPKALPLTQITMIRHPGPAGEAYALTLDSVGTAVYIGESHAARRGKYLTNFDPAKFIGITNLIRKSHFTEFDSYYGSTDNKTGVTTVSILWEGLRKSVVDRGGNESPAPKALKEVEAMLDSLVANAKWSLVKPLMQVPEFSPEYDTIPPKDK